MEKKAKAPDDEKYDELKGMSSCEFERFGVEEGTVGSGANVDREVP